MKLAPLPTKFSKTNLENSILISPKKETASFNTSKVSKTDSLASTTSVKPQSEPVKKSSNMILPLILIGGGVWYFTKS